MRPQSNQTQIHHPATFNPRTATRAHAEAFRMGLEKHLAKCRRRIADLPDAQYQRVGVTMGVVHALGGQIEGFVSDRLAAKKARDAEAEAWAGDACALALGHLEQQMRILRQLVAPTDPHRL